MKNTEAIDGLKNILEKIANAKLEPNEGLALFNEKLKEIEKEKKVDLRIETQRTQDFEKTTAIEFALDLVIDNSKTPGPIIDTLLSAINTLFQLTPNPLLLHRTLKIHSNNLQSLNTFEQLMAVFFKNKVDFNIRNAGKNAAYIAVSKGKWDLIPILSQFGCGINRTDLDGQTPLDIASDAASDIQKFLREEGAVTSKEATTWVTTWGISFLNPIIREPVVYTGLKGKTIVAGGFAPQYKKRKVQDTEADFNEIKYSPGFDPNKGNENNPTAAFKIIHTIYSEKEKNDIIARAHLKKCITLGLQFDTRNKDGKTFLDILAEEKRLNIYLSDPFIRATFLSSMKFELAYVHQIIEQEQKELEMPGPTKTAEDKEVAKLLEQDMKNMQRQKEIHALTTASGQTLTTSNQGSEQKRAIGYMVTNLKKKTTPESLNSFKKIKLFQSSAEKLNSEHLWNSVLEKLQDANVSSQTKEHWYKFINEQIANLTKQSQQLGTLKIA